MISWDEAKRQSTLVNRGLDFAHAQKLFDGLHFDREDDRIDYGEIRYITAGRLDGRFVVIVWTPRQGGRHIISMRYGHAKEERRYEAYLD